METTRSININRQLKDIISQADQLRRSTNLEADIENFSKYNEELKVFLLANFDDPMIYERVMKIPRIDYKAIQYKLWHWLTIIFGIQLLLINYSSKQKCLRQAEEAKSLYSSILFLIGKN